MAEDDIFSINGVVTDAEHCAVGDRAHGIALLARIICTLMCAPVARGLIVFQCIAGKGMRYIRIHRRREGRCGSGLLRRLVLLLLRVGSCFRSLRVGTVVCILCGFGFHRRDAVERLGCAHAVIRFIQVSVHRICLHRLRRRKQHIGRHCNRQHTQQENHVKAPVLTPPPRSFVRFFHLSTSSTPSMAQNARSYTNFLQSIPKFFCFGVKNCCAPAQDVYNRYCEFDKQA